NLTKTEVRKIAAALHLKTKDKKESQEICFVPDDNYPRFLKEKHPELATKLDKGEITDQQGNVLGHHQGYPFYTIGQRRGLGVAVGKPVYVTEIDPKKNRIIVRNMPTGSQSKN
ncbi:MAG: tRNA 2-thiouridine(34) synthase MnmA, partial [bacterium]|nr:tRNA 2-thiouridine(34) synthase MnmA [bacterium]